LHHLVEYRTQRFQQNSLFMYYIFNFVHRHKLLKQVRHRFARCSACWVFGPTRSQLQAGIMACKTNSDDLPKQLTKSELKDLVASSDGQKLMRTMSLRTGKLFGGPSYMFDERNKLESAIQQHDPPTFFFTLSHADNWDPKLAELLDPRPPGSRRSYEEHANAPRDEEHAQSLRAERCKNVRMNPVLTSSFDHLTHRANCPDDVDPFVLLGQQTRTSARNPTISSTPGCAKPFKPNGCGPAMSINIAEPFICTVSPV